ncbi:MAG: LD-carboxypeptidase [Bacteroidetes bacterium]|nr:MAG: LD-carboxypeptidase [Bacteroidota bacterium]
MNIIKPKALRHGDVIGIAAPASPPASTEHLTRGIRYLEQLGFRVELGASLYKRAGYLAGSDRERASDLHTLFSNKNVKAIFTVRGGYGCTRILPLLDYKMIRKNPKILVGYSDITALQLSLLTKAGMATFSGPMVAVEMAGCLTGRAEEAFWQCVTSRRTPPALDLEHHNRRIIRAGTGDGVLYGGNLSLVASLVGTNYFPRIKRSLLMLEEIEERPYRVNRMLNQLKLAGVLKNVSGIALGLFTGCDPESGKPSLTLQQVFEDSFNGYEFPVAGHFHYGHTDDVMTVPFGITARLDTQRKKLKFLENAVE